MYPLDLDIGHPQHELGLRVGWPASQLHLLARRPCGGWVHKRALAQIRIIPSNRVCFGRSSTFSRAFAFQMETLASQVIRHGFVLLRNIFLKINADLIYEHKQQVLLVLLSPLRSTFSRNHLLLFNWVPFLESSGDNVFMAKYKTHNPRMYPLATCLPQFGTRIFNDSADEEAGSPFTIYRLSGGISYSYAVCSAHRLTGALCT